jgi:hypothetical protein
MHHPSTFPSEVPEHVLAVFTVPHRPKITDAEYRLACESYSFRNLAHN